MRDAFELLEKKERMANNWLMSTLRREIRQRNNGGCGMQIERKKKTDKIAQISGRGGGHLITFTFSLKMKALHFQVTS